MLIIFPFLQMHACILCKSLCSAGCLFSRPIFKRLFFMVMIVLPGLHTLRGFLFQRLHPFQKAVGVDTGIIAFQQLLHPYVRFSSGIQKQITLRSSL